MFQVRITVPPGTRRRGGVSGICLERSGTETVAPVQPTTGTTLCYGDWPGP